MAVEKAINPFINDLRIPYIEYVTDMKMDDKGEMITYGYNVETDESTRLYTSKRNREFLFRNLSARARDYFTAIQYFTNKEYKYVIVTYEKMCELYGTKLSPRGYDDTIKELMKFAILDCKDKSKGEYWYNPIYFCPGNRLIMYEECAVKIMTKKVDPRKLKL